MGLLVGILSIAPLICVLFLKSPYFISGEFIAYRFGDSMKLRYGEPTSVRPVQGIPTALLSRALLALNPGLGSRRGISRADLDYYARSYAITLAALVVLLSIFAWRSLSLLEASIVSLFLLAPWYVGVASMALLLSPDYWLGEWIWLAATLAILAKTPGDSSPGSNGPSARFVYLGVWMAIGATIKISLLGIAPILFISFVFNATPRRLALDFLLFVGAVLLAYPTILVIYMGSVPQGLLLLIFQLSFFHSPNDSIEYSGLLDALRHKVESGLLIAIALAASYIMLLCCLVKHLPLRRPIIYTLIANFWLLLYLLMLSRRPHDSTLTSISLSALFIITYMIFLFPSSCRNAAGITAVTLLAGAAVITHFPAERELSAILGTKIDNVEAADSLTEMADRSQCAIWFMPSNYWNAVLIPQLLGYNGGLGLYPVTDSSGQLSYEKATVFRRLWPNTFIMGASSAQIEKIDLAVTKGATVFYTRPAESIDVPVDPSYSLLLHGLRASGYSLVEVPVLYNGRHWLFGHSEITPIP
jgi:hypothetical protein